MKTNFYFFRFLFPAIFFSITVSSSAQIPEADRVEKLAIYKAVVGASDELPDDSVNYNINNPVTIDSMFSQIDVNVLRDCSKLEADCNGYVYVKFYDGTRQVYHLFATWTHLSMKGSRNICYFVYPAARELFKNNAQ
ncbi:MAG: hypothetical protein RBS55_01935 [Bacteroidales bacterium]|jgi:hypothetical protein|nr:hypothetical protein [Bacteroidales bacterium]